jgi:hypothetical protein
MEPKKKKNAKTKNQAVRITIKHYAIGAFALAIVIVLYLLITPMLESYDFNVYPQDGCTGMNHPRRAVPEGTIIKVEGHQYIEGNLHIPESVTVEITPDIWGDTDAQFDVFTSDGCDYNIIGYVVPTSDNLNWVYTPGSGGMTISEFTFYLGFNYFHHEIEYGEFNWEQEIWFLQESGEKLIVTIDLTVIVNQSETK